MGKYAFQYLEKAALQGDAEEQFILGTMYAEGAGVEKDTERAKEWYEKAAAQGHEQSEEALNKIKSESENKLDDNEQGKAEQQLVTAGEKLFSLVIGCCLSIFAVVICLYNSGSPSLYWLYALMNPSRSAVGYCHDRQCFEKAAIQGDAHAMYVLGERYGEEKWLEKAADNGDYTAVRDMVDKGISAYSAGNYQQARESLERFSAYFHNYDYSEISTAEYYLGEMYYSGDGGKQDYAKAAEWYEKAVAHRNAQAQWKRDSLGKWRLANCEARLGYMYDEGQGVRQDYNKAKEWYEKAADLGSEWAMNNLGAMYHDGKGVRQDYSKARELYERSAAQGFARAQRNLGVMYEHGQSVRQDYSKAKEWYEKAATGLLGDEQAQCDLGVMYALGLGVKQNDKTAREWFGKACDNGSQRGCELYKELKNRW